MAVFGEGAGGDAVAAIISVLSPEVVAGFDVYEPFQNAGVI